MCVVSTTLRHNFLYSEAAASVTANGVQNYANLSFVVRVPQQAVMYTPNVSEVLKFAWIQYAAFFIIVAFLMHRLSSFVFRNQLLHAYTTVDVMSNKSD